MKKSKQNKKKLNKNRRSVRMSGGAPKKVCGSKNRAMCGLTIGCAWEKDPIDDDGDCEKIECANLKTENDCFKPYCVYIKKKEYPQNAPAKCVDGCDLLNSQYIECRQKCKVNNCHKCNKFLEACDKVWGCLRTGEKCERGQI
jgi:hypothetical protein